MDNSQIFVKSIMDPRDEHPYVLLTWNQNQGQLTPDEARQFALQILSCADASEQDAFLVEFLVHKLEQPMAQVGLLLAEFREWRQHQNPVKTSREPKK